MKSPIIAAILLVLAVPAFADEKPTGYIPKDWSIFYDVLMPNDKILPLFYWQEFDTESQCLSKLQELLERVIKTPANYSTYSNMRCGKTAEYAAMVPAWAKKKP